MNAHLSKRAARWIVALVFVAGGTAALAQSEPQSLVDAADTTFSNFMRDPDMTWLHNNIGRARGVLIAPQVAKAGFIFGGSGGRAVLIVHDSKSRKWQGPAFYTLATASVGFQAGISVSEVLTLVMTEKALNALLSTSVKLGPDVSIAAGPVGAGANADVITDLVSYARSKGVYGGLNLEGTVVALSNDWNETYYHKTPLTAVDILVRGGVHTKGADKLIADVSRAAGKK